MSLMLVALVWPTINSLFMKHLSLGSVSSMCQFCCRMLFMGGLLGLYGIVQKSGLSDRESCGFSFGVSSSSLRCWSAMCLACRRSSWG